MAPVIAIPYVSQILNMQPPGVNTEGLVEILTTPVGSREATDIWSYPDYVDLRDANTGMTLVGWTYVVESEVAFPTPGGEKTTSSRPAARL